MSKRRTVSSITGLCAALGLTSAIALGSMMHERLGAHLSGMGEHGTVNLQVTSASGKICWTFDLPMVKHISRTSIHVGSSGATLLEFGMHYSRTGCEKVASMTLEHLEARPAAYWVWVDTMGHPGDLRGRLSTGMAHTM
jgi:hypothetical protein